MCESFYCSTSSSAFDVVSIPDFGHSDWYAVTAHSCLNWHFSDDIWCGRSLHMLICHLYIFFGEVFVKVSGPFFEQVYYFLIVESHFVFRVNCVNSMVIRGPSLMAQWLRICMPMQGTRVRALVREDPTCLGATKPVHHNYWACALEPVSHNYWAHVPQLLKPVHLEPMLCNKRSHCNEKLAHLNKQQPPFATNRKSPGAATKTQHSQK